MDDKKEVPASQIVITFQEPGSVNMSVSFQNIVPLQIISAAWYLNKHGEGAFIQQEMMKQQQQEANKIAVPNLQMKPPIMKPK